MSQWGHSAINVMEDTERAALDLERRLSRFSGRAGVITPRDDARDGYVDVRPAAPADHYIDCIEGAANVRRLTSSMKLKGRARV